MCVFVIALSDVCTSSFSLTLTLFPESRILVKYFNDPHSALITINTLSLSLYSRFLIPLTTNVEMRFAGFLLLHALIHSMNASPFFTIVSLLAPSDKKKKKSKTPKSRRKRELIFHRRGGGPDPWPRVQDPIITQLSFLPHLI